MVLPDDQEVASPWQSVWPQYRVPIIVGGASLVFVGISLILLVKSTQNPDSIRFSHSGSEPETLGTQSASLKTSLKVDVQGAVVAPGVYELTAGARVEDALAAAKGLSKQADTAYLAKNINRAMKVADGMKIYVPSMDETSHTIDSLSRRQGDSTSYNKSSDGQSQNTAMVSVNMASESELDSLPGVGPATARKIIDNRPYGSLDELVSKKAIGPSLYAKIKNDLSL